MIRYPRVGGLVLGIGLLAASCGGNSDTGASPSSVESTTSSALVTTTSDAGVTTTVPDSTAAIDGELFVDPEGSYELVVMPQWVSSHGSFAVGMEVWAVEEPGPFTSNVNILTQVIPSGTTLEDYLRLSIDSAEVMMSDFTLLDSGIVDGHEGQPLAVVTYEGSPTGERLRFLGVFAVRDSEAVVATLTTPPDRFNTFRSEIEPYLLTLRTLP